MSDERTAYVAIKPCGCVAYKGIKCHECANKNATGLANCIKTDCDIQTMPYEQVRDMPWDCAAHDPKNQPEQTLLEECKS